MRRLMATALALVATLAFQTGCGGDDEPDAEGSKAGQGYEVVFITGVTGDDFFHTIWLGAKEAPPKYEPASQIPIVNAAVARRPDALIVAATDAEALQAPLEQAAKRGIKVVTFDTTTADPSFAVTHVSSAAFASVMASP